VKSEIKKRKTLLTNIAPTSFKKSNFSIYVIHILHSRIRSLLEIWPLDSGEKRGLAGYVNQHRAGLTERALAWNNDNKLMLRRL
jgi:hypothetical protein